MGRFEELGILFGQTKLRGIQLESISCVKIRGVNKMFVEEYRKGGKSKGQSVGEYWHLRSRQRAQKRRQRSCQSRTKRIRDTEAE